MTRAVLAQLRNKLLAAARTRELCMAPAEMNLANVNEIAILRPSKRSFDYARKAISIMHSGFYGTASRSHARIRAENPTAAPIVTANKSVYMMDSPNDWLSLCGSYPAIAAI
jgi:hypothetical protein